MDDLTVPPTAQESSKKTDKIPLAILYNILSDWVNHKSQYLPETFRNKPFPKSYRAIKQDMSEDMPSILEQFKDKGGRPLVRFSSLKSMSMEAAKELRKIAQEDWEFPELNMTAQSVEKALQHWAIISTTNGGIPPAMVGHDDPKPAFYRLQYEPLETAVEPKWMCPTWEEIGDRTTNWEAFCMRVASIFDPHADRKQAIYMSGPKDCGKSQLEALIAHLAGGDTASGGGYCSLAPDQANGAHWLEPLVGKRVVCISEAASDFLESSRFKSLTGDLWHMVNPKGKAIVNRPLPVILFLFGNEPPEMSGKPELLERVIDCRITPPTLDGKGLIPDHEYQQQLKDELPAFLGHCYQLYEPYRGRRLPNDKGSLQASSDMRESEAIDFFHMYYKLDPDGEVPGEVVRKQMEVSRLSNTRVQKLYREIWERRFGVKKTPKRNGYFYVGMRKLSPNDAGEIMAQVDF